MEAGSGYRSAGDTAYNRAGLRRDERMEFFAGDPGRADTAQHIGDRHHLAGVVAVVMSLQTGKEIRVGLSNSSWIICFDNDYITIAGFAAGIPGTLQ